MRGDRAGAGTIFIALLATQTVGAIEALVSLGIVVFENSHRNEGWQDFEITICFPSSTCPRTNTQQKSSE